MTRRSLNQARIVRTLGPIRFQSQPLQQQFTGPGAGGGEGGNGGGGDGAGGEGGNAGAAGTGTAPEQKAGETTEQWKERSRTWENRATENKQELDKLKNSNQATMDAVAVALGLKKGEHTPEQLAQKLEESNQTAAQALSGQKSSDIKLAVYIEAGKHEGLTAESLIDSISFMEKANQLDPKDAKFADKVAELVKEKAPKQDKNDRNGLGQQVNGGKGGNTGGDDENDPRKLVARLGNRY